MITQKKGNDVQFNVIVYYRDENNNKIIENIGQCTDVNVYIKSKYYPTTRQLNITYNVFDKHIEVKYITNPNDIQGLYLITVDYIKDGLNCSCFIDEFVLLNDNDDTDVINDDIELSGVVDVINTDMYLKKSELTNYAVTKTYVDEQLLTKPNKDDVLSLSGGTLTGGLTGTTITTTDDIYINSLRMGRGGGAMTNNLGIGNNTLLNNTSGNWNIAIGGRSLEFNTTGGNNAAIGGGAMMNNTTGEWNVGIGASTLRDNISGSYNVGVGGFVLGKNIDGIWNIGVGTNALAQTLSNNYNTALGAFAIGGLTVNSHNNIGIGYRAARTIDGTTTYNNANNCIYIGNNTLPLANGMVNEIVIGDSAKGNGSNSVTIGKSDILNNYLYGTINANSFKVYNGLSNQFLKADGSVDSTLYATQTELQSVENTIGDINSILDNINGEIL